VTYGWDGGNPYAAAAGWSLLTVAGAGAGGWSAGSECRRDCGAGEEEVAAGSAGVVVAGAYSVDEELPPLLKNQHWSLMEELETADDAIVLVAMKLNYF